MTMSPAKMNFPWSLREIIKFIHLKRKNFFFFENEKKKILRKIRKFPNEEFLLRILNIPLDISVWPAVDKKVNVQFETFFKMTICTKRESTAQKL